MLQNLLRHSRSRDLVRLCARRKFQNVSRSVTSSISGPRRQQQQLQVPVGENKNDTSTREKQRPSYADHMIQGQKVHATFSADEFHRRLSLLRQHMSLNNIGATIFTSIQNVNYYSGFIYCAFGRPYALIVTPDRSVVISAGIDGGQPWRRSFGADDCVIYTDWNKDNFYKAVRMVVGETEGPVGLEFDHVTLENEKKFDVALPYNAKVDIGNPIMYLRLKKSDEEINMFKEGARIADIGGAACVEAIQEGVPEHEIALSSTNAMVREIATTYPDMELLDTWTWFMSGINTDGAHNHVTSRKIKSGDILSLNCFPMLAGYYMSLERTLFFGHPTKEQLRMWQINCEVHRRGLQLLRPGTRCSEVASELNEIYRSYDILMYRSFGFGYSFGSMTHYYGRESALEFREDFDTVLEPGMIVSMVPMINVPMDQPGGGGYREHDMVVITEDGAEDITKFPFGPEDNIILK